MITILIIYLIGVVGAWVATAIFNDKYNVEIGISVIIFSYITIIAMLIVLTLEDIKLPYPTLKYFKKKK